MTHARLAVPLCLVLLGAALPSAALAVGPDQKRDGIAPYDVRSSARNANRIAEPSDSRSAAADRLSADLGTQGQVSLDRVTTTPRSIAKLDGFLTGASKADPKTIALDYVNDHPNLFGLGAGDIGALKLVKDYTDALGTDHLVWAQQVDGVPAVDNGIRAAVAKDGRLVQIGGSPLPSLSVSTTPKLTAAQALQAARDDAGIKGTRPAVQKAGSGARRITEFQGDNQAKLGIYTTFGGPRLVWRIVADKSSTQLYDYMVDADTGEVLHRDNTVKFATGLAWDYFPGPIPYNNSGVATSRDFTAKGWLASTATKLDGNNTHTYFDLLDDNTPAAGDEVPPSSGSNWNYPLTAFDGFSCIDTTNFPCSWDSWTANSWQANMKQNATQIFYFVNNFHDYLKNTPAIAFTEAAGNFQGTNSTGQGAGGDPVQAQVLDGANTDGGFPDGNHFNNANMGTRADGTPPRMQMYLMSGMGPSGGDVNSGDDASVIYHEYTHGLSSRLVTDNDGNPALNAQQSGSMGEGWSDWYAMDFLVNHGYDADNAEVGDVNTAFYVAGGPGFRSQPLDCPVNFADEPCTNFNGAGDGGYTYGDFGKVAGGPEVHADGEIWHQTLWELRQRLVQKYGAVAGDARVQTYVTRGMEFTPPSPSMIDARNGILQAETVATATGGPFSGDDDDVLWQTFADRGMGYFAAAVDGNDVNPIANFSQPPAPGAPKGTLTGTVTMQDGGAPAPGARVEIGGHNSGLGSDLAATTASNGTYSISGVPNGTYPYVFVGGNGYDRVQANNVVVNGTTTKNFTVRRNWAQRDGGGTVDSFSAPDLSGSGCGPQGAIDGSQATGWGSTSPSSSQGPGGVKQLTIKLPRAITLAQYAVDPGATCGDDDKASVGSYKIETSTNGTTFTQTNAGTFTATNNHKLNTLTPAGGTANVRYVRFTMNAPQSTSGSGADWMDMSELKVYGTPVIDGSARADFNADGYADLAIGAPNEDVGSIADAGSINVLYGSSTGVQPTGSQVLHRNSTAVIGSAQAGAKFGAAIAAGDFNGDGYDDLAVGAPGDTISGKAGAGSVTILLGSGAGLTGTGSKQWTQDSSGILDSTAAGDGFGSALTSANLGRGAQDDLAIGVPNNEVGTVTDAGAVNVLYGGATGLASTGNQLLTENALAAGTSEASDHFGAALAAGNVGKTAEADLAIGVPNENGAVSDSGAVVIAYGGSTGVATTGNQEITQNTAGVPGSDTANDQFGFAVAIGDIVGSSTADVVVGVPGKIVGGDANAGEVAILTGGTSGVTTTGAALLHQDSSGMLDSSDPGDRFGAAIAIANFGGTSKADLAVGAPGELVGTVAGAGQVSIVYGGTAATLSSTGNKAWSQDSSAIHDTSETNDHFGAKLSVAQFNGSAAWGLAIGVPDEDIGAVADAGAVQTLYGGASAGNQFLSQNTAGIPDTAETSDHMGGGL